ncbi:MAG TPA: hypothetical protein DCY88_05070 [Cyanobacteria bacterium UBA11372]|nr:hypothetical protein [Cyanobacteria bacterium UBA11372]
MSQFTSVTTKKDNLVILKLESGDFEQGFLVKFQSVQIELEGKLPHAPHIIEDYKQWSSTYQQLRLPRRKKFQRHKRDESISLHENCQKAAQKLGNSIKAWLNSAEFYYLTEQLPTFDSSESIHIVVQAKDIQLQRLPWHFWDWLKDYPNAEIALSPLANEPIGRPAPVLREKIRVLAILGSSINIQVEQDIEKIKQLLAPEQAELVPLFQPSRDKLFEVLWDEKGWDILFYAGHSASEINGETGWIEINENERLTISELRKALNIAINSGLKLAIFNSCDGLGLGRELASVHLPYAVVMREEVPDPVALEFLQAFFQSFISGQSLPAAMSQARKQLKKLETEYPCGSWLPVICQERPEQEILTWQKLRDTLAEATWRGCCQVMLAIDARTRLKNHFLIPQNGIGYELAEIKVPSFLLERKQQARRYSEVSPEFGSQLYAPEREYEVSQIYEQNAFFEQIFQSIENFVEQRQRLAIIGEPGAGKTTLLQDTGDELLTRTKDAVPIWVSLADLKNKTLDRYLLEDWLNQAKKTIYFPEATEESLKQLFSSGRVWLLLDGVDELTAESVNPLNKIVSQLKDWVDQANVILTCRLNVWETNGSTLQGFSVYPHPGFSYGNEQTSDQVGDFIKRWFKGKPELGERLRTELNNPKQERVRDLAKNPLRLSLLCHTWWQRESLPQTKAELYQQFTVALYQWKSDVFLKNPEPEKELNAALARLARQAIDQNYSRFRLRYSSIAKEMKNKSLFKLACQLGWLNQVGVAAENPSEAVYAFYHPTFQEYFAALAIDDWKFFINHARSELRKGTYRIFQKHWEEVILLWLGRNDVPKQQKDALIQALVSFDSDCDEFYRSQAYFLAASGIAEFRDSSFADRIVGQLVEWGFGYLNAEKDKWVIFPKPIELEARERLKQTDKEKTITFITQLIKTCENSEIIELACNFLQTINVEENRLISPILHLLGNSQNEKIILKSAEILDSIASENEQIFDTSLKLIKISHNQKVLKKAIKLLRKVAQRDIAKVVAALEDLLDREQNHEVRKQAAKLLVKLDTANQKTLENLVTLIKLSKWDDQRKDFIQILKKVKTVNQPVLNLLTDIINTEIQNDYAENLIVEASECLGKLDSGNQLAIKNLEYLVQNARSDLIRLAAAESFIKIVTEQQDRQTVINALINLFKNGEYHNRDRVAFILWQINPGNSTALLHIIRTEKALETFTELDPTYQIVIPALKSIIQPNENEYNIIAAANILGNIDSEREVAINTLLPFVNIDETDPDFGYGTREAAETLGKIVPGHPTVISTLSKLLQIAQNEYRCRPVLKNLEDLGIAKDAIPKLIPYLKSDLHYGVKLEIAKFVNKFDPGNQDVIESLTEILKNNSNEKTLLNVAKNLGEINPGNPTAVLTLEELIKKTYSKTIRRKAAIELLQIAPNNPTAITTLVKCLKTASKERLRLEILKLLANVPPGNQEAITALVEIIETTDKQSTLKEAAKSLSKINPGNETAFLALLQLIHTVDTEFINEIKTSLRDSIKGDLCAVAITHFKQFITDPFINQDSPRYKAYCDILWYCSQNWHYSYFHNAWHSQPFRLTDFLFKSQSQQKAFDYCQQLLKTANKSNDRHEKVNARINLGKVYYWSGKYLEAQKNYEKGLKLAEKIGHLRYQSNCLNGIANIHYSLKDYPQAIKVYENALEIARKIDDYQLEIIVLINLGKVYDSAVKLPEAIDYSQQALEIARTSRDYENHLSILKYLINLYSKSGNFIQYYTAFSHYNQSYNKLIQNCQHPFQLYASSHTDPVKQYVKFVDVPLKKFSQRGKWQWLLYQLLNILFPSLFILLALLLAPLLLLLPIAILLKRTSSSWLKRRRRVSKRSIPNPIDRHY